jgi:inorganic pyrophosphatase
MFDSMTIRNSNDIENLYQKLGEPLGFEERELARAHFDGLKDISFEFFLEFHDELIARADRNKKSQFRAAMTSHVSSIDIESIKTQHIGSPPSFEYRLAFVHGGRQLSPWHDIPFQDHDGHYIMVCEIPKYTVAKYEIATRELHNPIKQDVKNSILRSYPYVTLFNYGAIPRTYEDPNEFFNPTHEGDGFPGDNDPLDCLEIGLKKRQVGDVIRVKVLGVIPMVDEGEMDWKVLSIAIDDPLASLMHSLEDIHHVMPGYLDALLSWFQKYKTVEPKFAGEIRGKEFAEAIIQHTHSQWLSLCKARDQVASGEIPITGIQKSASQIFQATLNKL